MTSHTTLTGRGSVWRGPVEAVAFDAAGIAARLRDLAKPCYVVQMARGVGVTHEDGFSPVGLGVFNSPTRNSVVQLMSI